MLLRGLTVLVFFQLLGTGLNALWLHRLPGPIIGLVLLLVFLLVRGRVGEPVEVASSGLLRYLPVLLLPSAVGVMAHFDELKADFWVILITLVVSLVVSLLAAGALMQWLIRRQGVRKEET